MNRPPQCGAAFFGRGREFATLERAYDSAADGAGNLLLVGGEPGIGKSRLVGELGRRLAGRGALVATGRCREAGGARAYWPWIEALSALTDAIPEEAWLQISNGAARWTAALTADHPARAEPHAGPQKDETQRLRLFSGLSEFWSTLSRRRPVALILEDVHVADTTSLLLLDHLAQDIVSMRMLIVATLRNTEVLNGSALAMHLAHLATHSTSMELAGLDDGDTRAFCETIANLPLRPGVTARLRDLTGGNPFFLGELTRRLVELKQTHDPDETDILTLGVPARVRDSIRERVGALPDDCADAIRTAALLGHDFSLQVLATILRQKPEHLLATLEPAISAGLLLRPPAGASSHRFTHSIVRDAIYDGLGPARQAAGHARIAEALETIAAGSKQRLAELAHHSLLALPVGDLDRAIRCARLAAAESMHEYAYENAAATLTAILEHLQEDERHAAVRCKLTVELASALRAAGKSNEAITAYDRAADEAVRLGLPEQLALAATGPTQWRVIGAPDRRRIALLNRALEKLPLDSDALRARTLACLARELYWSRPLVELVAMTTEAVDAARRSRSQSALAFVLGCHCELMEAPEHTDGRTSAALELLGLADELNLTETAAQAHRFALAAHLSRADIERIDQSLAEFTAVAETLRQPFYLWWTQVLASMRAMIVGDFARAEQLISSSFAQEQVTRAPTAAAISQSQLFVLMREQGRHEELAAIMEAFVADIASTGGERAPRSGLAVLYAEIGRTELARVEYDRFAADGFADLPNYSYQMVLSCLADTCIALDDREHAGILYERLRPYENICLTLHTVLACLGPGDRLLGGLATVLERYDEAERHFRNALSICARLSSGPLTARTKLAYAHMLQRRHSGDDSSNARRLAGEVVDLATRLDMKWIGEAAATLTKESNTRQPLQASNGATAEHAQMVREGEFWEIDFAGKTCRVSQAIGMTYIARLLQCPGRPVHAIELAALGRSEPATAVRLVADRGSMLGVQLGPDTASFQSPLTAATRAVYQARSIELERLIDEATSTGDGARAALLREERALLAEELARSAGLRRYRRPGSPNERARINVARAIRRALARIANHHETLSSHLDRTICTGTFCSYEPDSRLPIEWIVSD